MGKYARSDGVGRGLPVEPAAVRVKTFLRRFARHRDAPDGALVGEFSTPGLLSIPFC
jgi:hypothetical protein